MYDTIRGTRNDDVLEGTDEGRETIYGRGGDDVLFGGISGGDRLIGGAGNDLLISGGGSSTLFRGGTGFDTVSFHLADTGVDIDLADTGPQYTGFGIAVIRNVEAVEGSDHDDVLRGNELDNVLFGGAGNDMLVGRGGDDILQGSSGDDLIDGGSGFDTAVYWDAESGVRVDLRNTDWQDTRGAGHDRLVDVESVDGSAFNDILLGTSGFNHLFGGNGNDRLFGRQGDDILQGGNGNDLLNGGSGSDFAAYWDAASSVEVRLDDGSTDANTATGGAGNDRLRSIENIYGSSFDDVLSGDAGSNIIHGGAGDDIISGTNTVVLSDDGAVDYLFGGDGDDVISSSQSVAVVEGGAGQDFVELLTVGSVAVYGLEDVQQSGSGDALGAGEGETLRATIREGAASIDLSAFGTLTLVDSFTGRAGELLIVDSFRGLSDPRLEIDMDGDGTADFRITKVDNRSNFQLSGIIGDILDMRAEQSDLMDDDLSAEFPAPPPALLAWLPESGPGMMAAFEEIAGDWLADMAV